MICPHCRDVASFKEHRDKGFTTLLGDVRPEARPYYHCAHCGSGHFPGDVALGLTGRRMSLGVEQIVTLGGTLTSFDEAATKILPKMAGIRLSESTVERTTEAHGERLGQLWEHGHTLGPALDWDWNRDVSGQTVAYISVGMDRADQWIGLSDGGNGLDDFFTVQFPRATLILDFYHAAGHLSDLAKAWSDDTVSAAALRDGWRHQMKEEGGAAVLRTLEALDRSGRSPEALEEYRLVTQYVRKNAYRMDYPTYQAKGWQIGSGSMESGCKTVICKRLCDGGMRWGVDGADSVSHLRALFRSEPGQWDAFWNQSRN